MRQHIAEQQPPAVFLYYQWQRHVDNLSSRLLSGFPALGNSLPWFARRDAAASGIALDAQGKIAWRRSEIGGDPIVVILTERVSDAHLAGLRQDGISYIFRRDQSSDLPHGGWIEGCAEHPRLRRQRCRCRGAEALNDAGEHRGVGGRCGLAPLSAPKLLI